jgi:hypothetical protein
MGYLFYDHAKFLSFSLAQAPPLASYRFIPYKH